MQLGGRLFAASLLAGTVALATGAPGRAELTNAEIQDFGYVPDEITIAAGDDVRWTNTGEASHTVTADEKGAGKPASGRLASGDSFSHTFTTTGTLAYHCEIHPSMRGVVRVVPKPTTSSSSTTTTTSPAPVSTTTTTTSPAPVSTTTTRPRSGPPTVTTTTTTTVPPLPPTRPGSAIPPPPPTTSPARSPAPSPLRPEVPAAPATADTRPPAAPAPVVGPPLPSASSASPSGNTTPPSATAPSPAEPSVTPRAEPEEALDNRGEPENGSARTIALLGGLLVAGGFLWLLSQLRSKQL